MFLALSLALVTTAQSKDEMVRYIRSRYKTEWDFISLVITDKHLRIRSKASFDNQHWIQEDDIDLSKVEDVIVAKPADDQFYWVKVVTVDDDCIVRDTDMETGKHNSTVKFGTYQHGFSKEDAYKVKKYLKQLAKLSGARVLEM